MTAHYLNITAASISQFDLTLELMRSDPDYLNHPECPFDDNVKGFLRRISTQNTAATVKSDPSDFDLLAESTALFTSMKQMNSELGTKDTGEKIQVHRVMTTLLEKIVSLIERSRGIKQMTEFQQIVMDTMETILTQDQRAEFMQKLQSLITSESQSEQSS